MPLTETQIRKIEGIIKDCLRGKFKSYNPETNNMPFHFHLLGRDRMALYSFIHSVATSFGISIFQPIAETLASLKFSAAQKQFSVGNLISEKAQEEIQHIMDKLSLGGTSNKVAEIERIRNVCTKGRTIKTKTVNVDLYVKDINGTVHLFEIKTAKPNKGNFKEFKRTLLEWIALYLFQHPDGDVQSYVAIPYNPYEPKPYARWTIGGMLDLEHELKVAEEFWDFLGGQGAYTEVLGCFERVGIELKPEIDSYFSRFK